jgi:hypothetical protein
LTTLGYFLGQLIGLAVFPAAIIWALRGTGTGRDVSKALVRLAAWLPRRRRARQARAAMDRWNTWVSQFAYWSNERAHHDPGTRTYELAQDAVNALYRVRPPRPDPCPFDGFTCPDPTCMEHPRSHQP